MVFFLWLTDVLRWISIKVPKKSGQTWAFFQSNFITNLILDIFHVKYEMFPN
jgi:hypothetical protein